MRNPISTITLALLSLADGAPAPATPRAATPFDLRRQLLATSTAECEHGNDGMLIELDKKSAVGANAIDTLLAKIKSTSGTKDVMFELPSINTVAAHLSDSGIDTLLNDPEVSIQPNCIIQLDPSEMGANIAKHSDDVMDAAVKSWGLDRIDSRQGTDGTYDDSATNGVMSLVYVLDTGVRISHQDFGPRASPGWSSGCPTGNEGSCGNDQNGYLFRGVITADDSRCNGHGTHCASTIGGKDYGVAKGVNIVTVQVLSCAGSGSYAGVSAGIEWAADDAVKRGMPAVISMSLGGGGSNVFDGVINAAHAKGVLTVVAAGNSNADACNYSPASTPIAITVGSTAKGDGRSSFSNHGKCVDIHAPGSSITGAWSGSDSDTRTISGTSMATPHVAGVIAQIRTLYPDMSADKVTEMLLCLATKDAVTGLPDGTVNDFLYNDLNSDDARRCAEGGDDPTDPDPPSGDFPNEDSAFGVFREADGKWTAWELGESTSGFRNGDAALRYLLGDGGNRGVKVLAGNAKDNRRHLACIDPKSDITAIRGRPIAAQCCEKNTCRRYVDGENNDEGCIAGYAQNKPPEKNTYSDAQAKCASLGLEMCDQSCAGEGCYYNAHPVYTSIPCTLRNKD